MESQLPKKPMGKAYVAPINHIEGFLKSGNQNEVKQCCNVPKAVLPVLVS